MNWEKMEMLYFLFKSNNIHTSAVTDLLMLSSLTSLKFGNFAGVPEVKNVGMIVFILKLKN